MPIIDDEDTSATTILPTHTDLQNLLIQIPDLQPSTTYEISISAIWDKRMGEAAEIKVLTEGISVINETLKELSFNTCVALSSGGILYK